MVTLQTADLAAGTYCVKFAVDLVDAILFVGTEFGADIDWWTFESE